MTCNSPDSLILAGSINKNIVTTKDGLAIPDAKHEYTNGGKGNGLLIPTSDGEIVFVNTDLNQHVLDIANILINNLEFVAVGTDPLALEIKAQLIKIKQLLKLAVKKIP